eukprot:363901-Chlamydomonas_euryale.AAC.39
MLSVEPRARHCAQEELRAVCVGPCVRHRQDAGLVMLQAEVLVGERLPVNRLATGSIPLCKVAALAHEPAATRGDVGVMAASAKSGVASFGAKDPGHSLWDDAVEDTSLEVKWLLAAP